eukprot:scaffold8203_cov143-Skeletonema_dohrnii-CCMP3373.AAC.1
MQHNNRAHKDRGQSTARTGGRQVKGRNNKHKGIGQLASRMGGSDEPDAQCLSGSRMGGSSAPDAQLSVAAGCRFLPAMEV